MDHNYSDEIANIRDSFLASEIDYLKELVEVPGFIELFEHYKEASVSELSNLLVSLTQKMENGEVKEEDARKVELQIMCCCLAIQDAVKTLGAKEITHSTFVNEEEANTRRL